MEVIEKLILPHDSVIAFLGVCPKGFKSACHRILIKLWVLWHYSEVKSEN